MCFSGPRLISRGRGTLAQERPDLVQQWDYEANKGLTPDTVQAGSASHATWRCGCCCKHCSAPHVWEARIDRRTGGTGCPQCCGHKVCACQSLAALRPDLMREWNWDANMHLDPYSLGVSSNLYASWVCPEHGSWSTRIDNRTSSGCPGCARDAKRGHTKSERGLLKDEYPNIFDQLHPTLNRNRAVPESITSGSNRKLYWLCTNNNRPLGCKHEHAWETTVLSRCRRPKGTGCPFCAGTVVCPCNSLAQKQPGVLQYWHYDKNKEVNPESIGPSSRLKVWWQHADPAGKELHEWTTSIHGFTTAHRKSGTIPSRAPCPTCCKMGKKERSRKVFSQTRKKSQRYYMEMQS